jgi:hypothetical protein
MGGNKVPSDELLERSKGAEVPVALTSNFIVGSFCRLGEVISLAEVSSSCVTEARLFRCSRGFRAFGAIAGEVSFWISTH